MLAYYCGAVATFVIYFAGMLSAGWVFDQHGAIDKKKLTMHSIVLVLLFVGATALVSRELRREAVEKRSGKLQATKEEIIASDGKKTVILQLSWTPREGQLGVPYAWDSPPSTLLTDNGQTIPSDGKKTVTLELGWSPQEEGIPIVYKGGPISQLLTQLRLLPSTIFNHSDGSVEQVGAIFDEIDLKVNKQSGNVTASVNVRGPDGRLLARLVDNEWQVNNPPDVFDRNYSEDTVEVVNSKGDVVLQLQLMGNTVRLNGVFYSKKGGGVIISHLAKWRAQFLFMNEAYLPSHIIPIFKYPSQLHLGEKR